MEALELFEITENNYIENPFPLSLDAQKRLLELVYNRKSGIISRQELIDVLFNPQDLSKGTLIKQTY
jgi:DNA-binding winged helix-turn-helix (wHTH) protein